MYFFDKGICSVQWGVAQRKLGNFREFFVPKVTLQYVSYRKNGGQDVLVLLPQ